MSGRGGRGRGRAPPTGARLLLQRSAQEAGLDAGNLRNLQDITRPRLFPDYEWHSSGRVLTVPLDADADNRASVPLQVPTRTPSTIYLVNKSREMAHKFQNSPSFVRPLQEADVVRYSKRPRPLEPDVAVADFMDSGGGVKEPTKGLLTDPDQRYFPAELLPKSHRTLSDRSMKELSAMTPEELEAAGAKPLTLEEMAEKELRRRRQDRDVAAGDGDDELGEEVLAEEEEEEDEAEDYMKNHYESDDDEGGGDDDDAEPTF